MQSLKSFSEVQDIVENFVQRLVFCSPSCVIYETSSPTMALMCKELLYAYGAYTTSKEDRHFIIVPL